MGNGRYGVWSHEAVGLDTFGAAVGYVAPVLLLVNLPQLGEPVQHPDLDSHVKT